MYESVTILGRKLRVETRIKHLGNAVPPQYGVVQYAPCNKAREP